MKPPPFDYLCATSVEEAITALAADEDAKVLAGGQSLVPLLNLRLARPTVLVDIGRLALDEVTIDGGMLRVGAMARQRRLELDPIVAAAVPLLSDAVAQVGYPATRNQGTIGGSLAHADPVAELPAVAVAVGGSVIATGPSGSRRLRCGDLADGFFTTTLAPDEIITEVHLAVGRGPAHGAAWCEWAPRAHDFAEAGVGVAVDVDDTGTCIGVGAAACGIGGGPLALGDVVGAAGVLGCTGPGAPLLRALATAVEQACGPAGDGERAELTGLLAARAVRRALARAGRARKVAT